MPRILIAIITYNRPQSLARALASLALLRLPEAAQVELLVVDNDPRQSAQKAVEDCKNALPFPVAYALEPRKGIPHARNHALAVAANGYDYLAFMDDDDIADSEWLVALYGAAETYGADVVKGQVIYQLPKEKEYLQCLDIFAPQAAATGTVLTSAWTNNVWLGTRIYFETGLRFDPAFSQTGGSDQHFFRSAAIGGARIVMCREAVIYSPVPPERTCLRWLALRHMRVGATLTRSDIITSGYAATLRRLPATLSDSAAYAWRILPAMRADRRLWIHPFMVLCFMLGRLSGALRLSPREYR